MLITWRLFGVGLIGEMYRVYHPRCRSILAHLPTVDDNAGTLAGSGSSYKEQQQQVKDKTFSHYGFLGLPSVARPLTSSSIKGNYVPVAIDQVLHIELRREHRFRRFQSSLYAGVPEPHTTDRDAEGAGLDGRKMSQEPTIMLSNLTDAQEID